MRKFVLPRSKKVTVLVGVAAVLVAGFAVASLTDCNRAQAASCGTDQTNYNPAGAINLAPNYFQFTDDTLAQAQKTGSTVLYFWAPWCSTCSSLDLELQEGTTSIPNGITLLRVNYDEASELKQKYGVTLQHTFVQVDANGEIITSWVGGDIVDFSRHIK